MLQTTLKMVPVDNVDTLDSVDQDDTQKAMEDELVGPAASPAAEFRTDGVLPMERSGTMGAPPAVLTRAATFDAPQGTLSRTGTLVLEEEAPAQVAEFELRHLRTGQLFKLGRNGKELKIGSLKPGSAAPDANVETN